MITDLIELQKKAHEQSANAGWWDDDYSGTYTLVPIKLALIHSEISEALEAHRKNLMDDKLPDMPGLQVELADAVIRILDLAEFMGYNITEAINRKMLYNEIRADHSRSARASEHGKKY